MSGKEQTRIVVDFLVFVLGLLALMAVVRTSRGQVVEHAGQLTLPATSRLAVPPPFLATQGQAPAAAWIGRGMTRTVDRFSPLVRGWLVRTANYDSASDHWNDGGALGDTKLSPCMMATVADRAIDGRGNIPPYPWSKPPTPWRADGVVLRGQGMQVRNLLIFQVPGTALVMREGSGPQAGTFGIFEQLETVDNLHIRQCINGFDCHCADAKLRGVWIDGIEQTALTLDAPNITLADSHLCGSDVGCRVKQVAQMSGTCYHEAARIGTLIEEGAHGTSANRLYIGPATCREAGVRVCANGCTLDQVAGIVAENTVGVDVLTGTLTAKIGVGLQIRKGGVGLRCGGKLHSFAVRGWPRAGATLVQVLPCTGCRLELACTDYGEGGIALDLSKSGLDKADGKGNVFDVRLDGTPKVIYPGGGEKYNLAPGTTVIVNGVRQAA